MSAGAITGFLLLWSLIGVAAFNLYVLFVFRSGMVYAARKPDGTLKEKLSLKGIASMLGFLALLVGFLVAANLLGLPNHRAGMTFGFIFLLDLALYWMWFLYDTLVIDWLVLGKWRPKFLKIPDEMGKESMTEHIRKSLFVGTLSGIVLALVASGITLLIW